MPMNKMANVLSDPKKAAWIILGLAMALCFALGFDVILYNDNGRLHDSVGQIKTQRQRDLITQHKAAIEACKAARPRVTGLITDLITAYKDARDNALEARNQVSKTDPIWKIRNASYENYVSLVHNLQGYLPIKCGDKKNTTSDKTS